MKTDVLGKAVWRRCSGTMKRVVTSLPGGNSDIEEAARQEKEACLIRGRLL